MAYLPLSEPGDYGCQLMDMDTGNIVTVVNTDPVRRNCYELQKTDGWSPDRNWRRVASINLGTVKLLAKMGDADAHMYFYEHDERARDRMIERHPEYFKACSGRI